MKILGYADKFSVKTGEELQIKVSCSNIKTYNASLVKIIQGDMNEKGPGYEEKKINVDLGGPFKARYQTIPIGSYGFVKNNKAFNKLKNVFISVLIFPTLLGNSKKQNIISKFNSNKNIGLELLIDENDKINFIVNQSIIKLNEKLNKKKWYLITAGYDYKKGIIFLSSKNYHDKNFNFQSIKKKKFIKKKYRFK